MADSGLDQWAAWLLHRRHGDDPAALQRTIARLTTVRDRVLTHGAVAAGDTVLDVGCGDGLIAFGALERVGPTGRVIFSDISQDLLEHDKRICDELGLTGSCQFVRASADVLAQIEDNSVDVVTTRSVLAYVARKQEAFAEFARVLRPGGRLSLYEPINRLVSVEPSTSFFGYDVSPVEELATRVSSAYEAKQSLVEDPMFTFDERDLLRFADEAGFAERHLTLEMHMMPAEPATWSDFAESSPNPLASTLVEAMAETLSPEERERFSAHLRPLVEQGRGATATAIAYLWGGLPR